MDPCSQIRDSHVLTWEQQVKIYESEINTYKIKLENMLSDTDDQSEKTEIIRLLIGMGHLLVMDSSFSTTRQQLETGSKIECKKALNDYERYTKMALNIAPKNALFNSRKKHDPVRQLTHMI